MAVEEEADLGTERSTEERVDASNARERVMWQETAERIPEAIAEIVEEAEVETQSREELEFLSAQIQAGLTTNLATLASRTEIEKRE